jgi:hypothetical protein
MKDGLDRVGNTDDSQSVMVSEMLRRQLRVALLAAVTALAAACQSTVPVPSSAPATSAPVTWGEMVPAPAADILANRPVVTSGPSSVTFLPISPTGAQIGIVYGYNMPHCGINSPIDVDGSFWDAVDEPSDSVEFDGQQGTFRLDTNDRATFVATNGKELRLARHSGAKEFRLCS